MKITPIKPVVPPHKPGPRKPRPEKPKPKGFTPGPWVMGGGGPSLFTILGDGKIHGNAISGATLIACTEKCDAEKANARLLAAAPELLETLEDAREQLRQAWACIEHIKEHAPDYELKAAVELLKDISAIGQKSDAVIAKATGGTE